MDVWGLISVIHRFPMPLRRVAELGGWHVATFLGGRAANSLTS